MRPPQAGILILVIGEFVNRSTRFPRPLAPESLDIRRRLPDRKGQGVGTVSAGTKPVERGYDTPELRVTAPLSVIEGFQREVKSNISSAYRGKY